MVERIDRPEAPPSYQITRAKDAKEDQHRPPSEREDQEKRYQKELVSGEWGKFNKKTMVIKPIVVARESVLKCLFRAVNLHSGIGTLQVDVLWKDGKKTLGALVLLLNVEHFFQLKKYGPGQEVPESFWARGPKVEFGIIEILSQGSKVPAIGDKEEELEQVNEKNILYYMGIIDEAGGTRWWVAAAYVVLLAALTGIILVMTK